MKLIPTDKYDNTGFSEKIKQQLDKISYYDNKINDLLLEKSNELVKENKVLTEINKRCQIELKSLKISLRNAQKSANHEKVNYKMLKLENKKLLLKSNDVGHSEELPRKKRKLLNENNITNRMYSTVEGLSVV